MISSLVVNGGKINSIISLGNTLIFFAEHETYYALFRDNRYVNLGGSIPFPELNIEGAGQTGSKTVSIDLDELGVYGLYRAFGEEYNSYKADHTNADESVQKILSAINEQNKEKIKKELQRPLHDDVDIEKCMNNISISKATKRFKKWLIRQLKFGLSNL